MMELTRSGVILCTERYEACVEFYRRTLGLPELLRDVPHTHRPVDDARGHAALYFSARRCARTRETSWEASFSRTVQVPGSLTSQLQG